MEDATYWALGVLIYLFGQREPLASRVEFASIEGVVVDSLHNSPLAAATVWALGDRRFSTMTDLEGHFRLDSLPAGIYEIQVRHPLIESLGLVVGAKRVALSPKETVSAIFAVPSSATIRTITCGKSASATARGLVVGRVARVDRSSIAGATVTLSWLEVQFEKGKGLSTVRRAQQARTGEEGNFAFCDVDESLEGMLSATFDGRATAAVRVSLADLPLATRMLFVPSAQAEMLLQGTVTGDNGRGIGGVRIEIGGSSDSTRTRDDGAFTLLTHRSGTQLLRLRAVGYDEKETAVDLTSVDQLPASISLDKTPQQLATLIVREQISAIAEQTGFTARAYNGPGYYLTAAQIASRKAPCILDYIANAPGFVVRRDRGGGCDGSISARSRGAVTLRTDSRATGFGTCVTVVVDDGVEDISAIPASDIVGIEFYRMGESVPPLLCGP